MAKKKSSEVNVNAFEILNTITDPPTIPAFWKPAKKKTPSKPAKNPAAVALGRPRGLKGSKAGAAKLSSVRRAQTALKAAKARWSKPS
jgi:hypothetical protein